MIAIYQKTQMFITKTHLIKVLVVIKEVIYQDRLSSKFKKMPAVKVSKMSSPYLEKY